MTALLVPLAALAGFGAGWLHFRSLEQVARRLAEGRLSAVALQIARLALLGFSLFLLAKAGAAPLLAGAAGLMLARARVLRGAR